MNAVATTELTPEQTAVVEAPIEARLLVLAGAGTGKTHVLVERIRRLVEGGEIAPGRELLVMSFSRAAVAELKARISLAEGDTRLVRPLTFDSFATRLLASHSRDGIWRELGYDGRIAAAVELLATEGGADAIGEYRHVFVDEIQDLVGVRAALVEAVTRTVRAFTLLGDPAQGIYDHRLGDEPGTLSSREFLARIRRDHPALQTFVLRHNFRGATSEAEAIDGVGNALRIEPVRAERVARDLANIYRGLEPLARFDDLAFALRGTRERVAVLCRTNIDALRVSRHLDHADVEHRLQRSATERVVPGWVATLFQGTERRSWSPPRLTALVEERLTGREAPSAEGVWSLLGETVGSDDEIEIDVLRRRLALGLVPDELIAPPFAYVTVSTIHRAKGREFDAVFTPQPLSSVEDEQEVEELRVLYVALSRARREIWTFPSAPPEPWHIDRANGDRWVKSQWRARWKTLALELRPDDLEAARPPGTAVVQADPRAIQEHLRDRVQPGDAVGLDLLHVRATSDGNIPFYAAIHDGQPIGETGESFGRLLAARLRAGRHDGEWPTALVGATTDGVETVVGLSSEGEAAGLGSTGLWLRPRLIGIGDLVWGEHEFER